MKVTYSEVLEPRRVGCAHAGCHDLRDMTVDVVTEECRTFLGHHAETTVWKKARLDQSLESVADTEDETAAVKQRMDSISDYLVIKHIRYELTATVRLVTCRESAADHEDMTLIDVLLHFCDRPEDIIFGKIAEYAHAHLCTRITPCLCRIVVTVCTREYREICNRSLNRLTFIFKVSTLCLIWLDTFHSCRNDILVICLCCIWVYLSELGTVCIDEFKDIELGTIDCENTVLTICHLTEEDCIRIVKLVFCLDEDRTVTVVEELCLIHIDLRVKTVTERHLTDSLCNATESKCITRYNIISLYLLVNILPVSLELLYIRHIVVQRSVLDQIKLVAFVFELRRDHLLSVNGSDTESHEHRRYVDILECSAHRVLTSDRRKSELNLHLESSKECRKRLAPRLAVCHSFEILLI